MNNCGKAFRKYTALFGLILTLSLTSSGTANASEMVSSAGKAEMAVPTENTWEIAERPGMVGRLYIPDCDISVAYYDVTYLDTPAQNCVVDGEDQGALIAYDCIRIVGDHNYQGFINIMQAVPDETRAYMLEGERLSTYVCVEADFGRNMIYQLTDTNGVSIEDRDSETLITYTCYTDWQNIYYCIWIPEENYLTKDRRAL